ncbi:flagellar filament capping protein FliD [Psychromonas aquimarina]|uniref:flagellar filament capping protein FliD n=1 Tax=Psychromonas aquimarina TaxID=444919 RepID=UPI0003FF1450|nr:flagellar filament capping protein FliD [Psychromonas aquimarina]
MAAITSTGLGSGLDINSIVTAIVGAEKDPALAKMTKSAEEATSMISAYGMVNSELSLFKSSYKDLSLSSTYSAATSSSSDSDVLSATLGIGAETGSWEFEVQQRAQAHTLVSDSADVFSSVSAQVGEGTIQLRYGTYSGVGNTAFSVDPDHPIETLTIDATNNSLEGMRDAINEGDYSVKASIINDGSNYRLVLTNKETGEKNGIELTAVDPLGDPIPAGEGLDRFTYSASDKNLTETSVAQDAKITMDGIIITRDSNEITSVIEGVTLNLNGETEAGKTVKLNITGDTSKVEDQVNAFVENYNRTISKMNELTVYNGEGASNGILNGDATVRNVQSLLRGVLNTQVDHIEGSVHSFADLGILTKRDGTLELDATKFADVLKNDMDGVADFFTATGAATDSQINFDSSSSLTKPGTYAVEVTQIATQGVLAGLDISGNFPLTIDAASDAFTMRVDGSLSNEITLATGTYNSIEDLATELQSKINSDSKFIEKGISVNIIEDAGKLSITSNKYGSSSNVAFTEVDTDFLAKLGIDVQSGAAGVNVEGKIAGQDALGDGQYLLSESGDSTGIKLLIEGGALGSRGNVTYAEGMTTVMNDLLTGIIDISISGSSGDVDLSEGILDSKLDSLYKKITGLEQQEEDLNYRMDKLEARLYKDFNAMDIAVSSLNNTMGYLKSALDALPGYTREN